MNKNFASALVIASVLASGAATAATINLGTVAVSPADPTSFTELHTKGVFTDTVNFTVATSALDSSANNLKVTVGAKKIVTYNITNLSYKLYTSTGTQIGGTYIGDDTTYTNILKAGSSYYFKVTGTAVGTSGGNYGFSLLTAAVPEPETYGMMLGGLGLIGFIAARRKKSA